MKNTLSKLTTGMALLLMVFAATDVLAQDNEAGTIEIGPGLVYGGQIETLGIKVDGYYTVNENIRAGVDLTYFFPENESFGNTDVSTNFFTIDLLGNYFFYTQDQLSAYGIGGLNIAIVSVEVGNQSNSESEVGLTLGGGVEYAVDFGNIFGELRLAGLGGDADQLVIGGGVRIAI